MSDYNTLGAARKQAQANADRDDCHWIIWRDKYTNSTPFRIMDEYGDVPNYYEEVDIIIPNKSKPVSLPVVQDRHTLTLNDEELELVKSIFKDKFDPAREFYVGSEKTKDSLFKKVCKALMGA